MSRFQISQNAVAALGMLVLNACALDAPTELEVEGQAANIAKGVVFASEQGVISFLTQDAAGVLHESCTGVLISPWHALTAAHCTDQAHTGFAHGTMRRSVVYFAPDGQRLISTLNEALTVDVISSWRLLDPAANDESDVESDMAIVTRPSGWVGTSSSDYVALFAGRFDTVRDMQCILFGAGASANDGSGSGWNGQSSSGVLRAMALDIEDGSTTFLFTATGFNDASPCAGDSGGPIMVRWPSGGDVVFGVHHGAETRSHRICANSDATQYAAKVHTRIDFIASIVSGCTRDPDGMRVRCF